MSETSSTKLTLIGSSDGAYCDPLTGECYSFEEKENLMTIAIDPVCKMEVEIETAQYKTEYEGKTYYFCAPGCQRSFEREPQKYLTESGHEHAGHHHH